MPDNGGPAPSAESALTKISPKAGIIGISVTLALGLNFPNRTISTDGMYRERAQALVPSALVTSTTDTTTTSTVNTCTMSGGSR